MHIGVYQSAGGALTIEQRLSSLTNIIETTIDSTNQPLDLVVCPELFACGYNAGDELVRHAQAQNGPITEQIAVITKKLNCHIIFGYSEREDNKLFNSAMCVSPTGTIIANHRKRLNSPSSFEGDYFTESKSRTLFSINGIKISLMICYEVEFPESVRKAAIDGAQLVVVPTALVKQWGVVADCVVPARAFENGVWLAYANHAGHENGLDYLGHSKIVAPDGKIEAAAGTDETLIYATIDTDRVSAAQARLPYLKNYLNA